MVINLTCLVEDIGELATLWGQEVRESGINSYVLQFILTKWPFF